MIALLTILLLENAFVAWIFNVAPIAGIGIVLAWITWRVASAYGSYEARFTRIEADLANVKTDVANLKTTVTAIDSRLGRVEGQLEIVIDLLKGKKIS